MDNDELTTRRLREFIDGINVSVASTADLSQPDPQDVKTILGERKKQRTIVFWFSIILTSLSFIFLVATISIQSYMRIKSNPAFVLLSGYELEVLSVAVFGQILGVIYIIAKSIWDDSLFKDFYKK